MRNYVVMLLVLVWAMGCNLVPKLDEVLPDKRTEYRKSESLPDLEVPPDLATDNMRDTMAVPEPGKPESTSYAAYQQRLEQRRGQGQTRRLEEKGITAGLLPEERALVVDGNVMALWPDLESFWTEQGFSLNLNDVELGVMETHWSEDAANRQRERYKVFVEPGEQSGTSVVYVSQAREQMVAAGDESVWRKREYDGASLDRKVDGLRLALADETQSGGTRALRDEGSASLEALAEPAPARQANAPAAGGEPPKQTMRSSEQFALGSPAVGTSTEQLVAQLVNAGEGKVFLNVRERFAQAWRATGEALGKVGARLENEDRDRGVYYVYYSDRTDSEKKGILSKLAFWKDSYNYQVSLTGVGNKTEVVVLDQEGRWDTSQEAGKLLSRLEAEINRIL